MEKKSNFVQVPLWLLDELETATEIRLFCKMYNGWSMATKAGKNYCMGIRTLKRFAGFGDNNSNTKVYKILDKFKELGIMTDEKNGNKKTKYNFNESILFHHELYESDKSEDLQGHTSEDLQGHTKNEGVRTCRATHKIHNKNIKENIHEPVTDSTCTGTEDNRTVPPDINGIQFWDNPLIYVMKLVSFPYDNYWCPLKDFIKQGYFKEVMKSISQLDNKELADGLKEDIDNCIQRLKSA